MEVEVTKIFLDNYRRYNNRGKVHNVLRDLRNRIEEKSNWLHDYKFMKNCAIKTTFRATLSDGDRLIMNLKPPLLLLDLGNHDTYKTWDMKNTKPAVQIQRSQNLGQAPDWLLEIFAASKAA
jgi:hypothetical protein